MTLEHGSVMPNSVNTTVILNTSGMTPNRFVFWIDGANPSHGYDDLSNPVVAYSSGTDTKDDRSIYVHNGSSAVLSGKVTRVDLEEFDITFDTFSTTPVNFLAIED